MRAFAHPVERVIWRRDLTFHDGDRVFIRGEDAKSAKRSGINVIRGFKAAEAAMKVMRATIWNLMMLNIMKMSIRVADYENIP